MPQLFDEKARECSRSINDPLAMRLQIRKSRIVGLEQETKAPRGRKSRTSGREREAKAPGLWADIFLERSYDTGPNGKQIVSVIIPARNEEKTIARNITIARSAFQETEDVEVEVIVTDGCSEDSTREEILKAGPDHFLEVPPGKGNAMREGFLHSRGDVVLFSDADLLNFEARWIEMVAEPILQGRADVVLGVGISPWFQGATETIYRPLIKLLFPEVEERISRQPLTGQRAFRRWVLAGLDLLPDYGVEAAMNIDLVNMKPPSRIQEVSLGEKRDVWKGNLDMYREVGRAILLKACQYERLSRLRESNFSQLVEILNGLLSEIDLQV
ncbi:hypothetical protein HKBW3S43_00262 [Candidatus Hakubella thermalkaliphila]|uniref:Glucosyl-3-phosphoglycerate synthase n=1 Tax=Candidatus Hakubella thermalkaliphila TaxID=2754717 RepID=A0A6V8NZG2_9ACTN|nr:glycosyltransferase [Candidatus Hakubella thermalkaliphila]GFP25655.1 hypothetical protein HKBW3S25_01136 [Candidatus Hakubella thermalkaliphila]GFP28496.1 hypothetical protein HKBW3S33_01911 [Candidatus Hakubella thermalkaliphila]GFP34469.1 hypothetical protein HKBW3S43_00262 [Candidatus Hakubella thermalkaliphila]GFP42940.1 hypothetical protein HKBW3C_02072 [Candidatus Hakubella thermalkaliphila]